MEVKHTPALRKLSNVVTSYLNSRGDYSKENYMRYLQIVIEGYTDLNIYHSLSLRSITKRVNDANMIALESDFIDWAKIGIIIGGILHPLGVNNSIQLPKDDITVYNPSVPEHLAGLDYSHYLDYSSTGGNRYAEFKVFPEKRKIQFRGSVKNYDILIEYISSGVSMEGDTLIPIQMIPVLRTYLKWQLLEYDDGASLNSKIRAEQQHGNELIKVVNAQNALGAEEFIDIIRSGYKQTVKR